MFNFEGCECQICKKVITQQDDIVVCPECGAPYHRTCYEQQGACVFRDRHSASFEWTPPKQQQQAQQAVRCPACGADNPYDNNYCGNCGAHLPNRPKIGGEEFDYNRIYSNSYRASASNTKDPANEWYRIDPNESYSGISSSDWSDYIGNASRKYLLSFKRMDLTKKHIGFSFGAMIFGPYYYLYRKAWKPAAFFLLISFLVDLPSLLYILKISESPLLLGLSTSVISGLMSAASILNFASILVRGLFGLYIYRSSAEPRIRKIIDMYPDPQQRKYVLQAQGGTSIVAAIAGVLIAYGVVIAVSSLLVGPNIEAMLNAIM